MDLQKVQKLMLAQLGKPYVFGHEANVKDPDPQAFDCAELCEWLCFQVGLYLPDWSQNQYYYTTSVDEPAFFDLAFLGRKGESSSVYHVGIVYSPTEILEAKGRNHGVVLSSLRQWETRKNFLGFRRIPYEWSRKRFIKKYIKD